MRSRARRAGCVGLLLEGAAVAAGAVFESPFVFGLTSPAPAATVAVDFAAAADDDVDEEGL